MRLTNAGVRGRHLRYTAPLVHLDHPRGYGDPEKMRRTGEMIRAVRRSGRRLDRPTASRSGRRYHA